MLSSNMHAVQNIVCFYAVPRSWINRLQFQSKPDWKSSRGTCPPGVGKLLGLSIEKWAAGGKWTNDYQWFWSCAETYLTPQIDWRLRMILIRNYRIWLDRVPCLCRTFLYFLFYSSRRTVSFGNSARSIRCFWPDKMILLKNADTKTSLKIKGSHTMVEPCMGMTHAKVSSFCTLAHVNCKQKTNIVSPPAAMKILIISQTLSSVITGYITWFDLHSSILGTLLQNWLIESRIC